MTFRRSCLAAALAAGDVALALSYRAPIAWALIALPLVALVLRIRVSPRVARPLVWISRALIATVAIGGIAIEPIAGLALAALAAFLLIDDESAALPAILGVLLAAALQRNASHVAISAWIAAAFIFIGMTRPRRIVALILFILPAVAVGTAIIRFLPWAQPRVERTTARFVTPGGDREGAGERGLGTDPMLGGVQRLTSQKRPVLRVWSHEPLALRTGVYTRFNGHGWEVEHRSHSSPLGQTIAPRGKVAEVVVATPLASLPAPLSPTAVQSRVRDMRIDAFDLVLAPRVPWMYTVQYGTKKSAIADGDLSLPETVDARVHALAEQLGPGDASVRAKIDRTVADLQARCRFTLDAGRSQRDDRVSEFLFEKKQGYCEYFATSAVLLLRLQGVPARYVTGFKTTARNRRSGYYLVRTTDAYAWAEAQLPDGKWMAVDAVPPAGYATVQDSMAMGAREQFIEPVRAQWSRIAARWREGGREEARSVLPAIAAIAAASAAGFIFVRWRRRGTRPRVGVLVEPDLDPALRSCFTKLEAVWARNGYARPRHRGPLEHARALRDDGLRNLSAEVVDTLYRGTFGGQRVTAEETAKFTAALDAMLPPSSRA